jgi:hypothetical protein
VVSVQPQFLPSPNALRIQATPEAVRELEQSPWVSRVEPAVVEGREEAL